MAELSKLPRKKAIKFVKLVKFNLKNSLKLVNFTQKKYIKLVNFA